MTTYCCGYKPVFKFLVFRNVFKGNIRDFAIVTPLEMKLIIRIQIRKLYLIFQTNKRLRDLYAPKRWFVF